MDLVWPDTFVTESSLARLTTELRDALGDDAKAPRFLRTVYGFGYAFCGDAREEPSAAAARPPRAPAFASSSVRREIPLLEGENILGRAEDARAHIDSAKASRRHARIVVQAGRATIEDLGQQERHLPPRPPAGRARAAAGRGRDRHRSRS